MTTDKFCIDCKHFAMSGTKPACARTAVTSTDPVLGEKIVRGKVLADEERQFCPTWWAAMIPFYKPRAADHDPATCGPAGLYWEVSK